MQETLKQLQRNAGEAVAGLQPFTFEGFEKAFILNNPSFHRRKAIKEVAELDNHPFNQVIYDNRFPIFRLPKPEPDTILAVFYFYISKLAEAKYQYFIQTPQDAHGHLSLENRLSNW